GDLYEVWFVGPGDAPDTPNRISAGTFHPDPDGRSQVTFAAAVDPALFPIVEITAEPGNGNPLPTGPVVLRVDVAR
ncbi:MAG: anti-sigma factor, partial [Ilumatobacteraceae bacterium]